MSSYTIRKKKTSYLYKPIQLFLRKLNIETYTVIANQKYILIVNVVLFIKTRIVYSSTK